jgi:hypothetical protein
VEQTLRHCLTITGRCEVASDMLGAARGICGHAPGIACILGTGSKLMCYDGSPDHTQRLATGLHPRRRRQRGRARPHLVGDILKNQLPGISSTASTRSTASPPAEIIDRVVRQNAAQPLLASFAPFLSENIDEPCIEALVKEAFRRFLQRNVKQYAHWDSLPSASTAPSPRHSAHP